MRLGEVASVQLAAENERAYMRYNGEIGIALTVEAQSKANTLDVVRAVRAEIERIRPTACPKGTSLRGRRGQRRRRSRRRSRKC